MVNASSVNKYSNLNIFKVIGLKLRGMWNENSTVNYYEIVYCIWSKFKGKKLYDSGAICCASNC